MAATAREIFARESISAVEKQVAPLAEVFRLQDAAELERAEARYLPTRETAPRRARPLPASAPAVRVPVYS
jgi:phosphoenolpyruvate phosphomutase